MRIAHISDTHIRNLKYHAEYRSTFDALYRSLRDNNVDVIVHCGDIAHNKTQITPEFVHLCGEFLESLADIAPLYILMGNHDGNLKNSTRQDAITPIVRALSHPNIKFAKTSNVYGEPNYRIFCLSEYDKKNWGRPIDDGKINIALYHGALLGAKTDSGWEMDGGETDATIFEGFDYVMLGDIHKQQQVDRDGRAWYAGSTIQQNFGEEQDKGYLLWDIKSKNQWTVTPIVLPNISPFITVELDLDGKLPNVLSVPFNSKIRLMSQGHLAAAVVHEAVGRLRTEHRAASVVYAKSTLETASGIITTSSERMNVRSLDVQEKLIRDYLTGSGVSDELLEEVLELNRKSIQTEDEIVRNIRWKLKNLEWDNLFNYGPSNSIDFETLGGVVGIFGKNYSGKSSIVDSLLYTMFNTTSKRVRKNLEIINEDKQSAMAQVSIAVDNDLYEILRTSEKYTKKVKGLTTEEARTTVSFQKNGTEANGLTRQDTDAAIRSIFGDIDDFLMTSVMSQWGALNYLSEGSTKRKEILARFLDLGVFEQKFNQAKQEIVGVKSLLKRWDGRNFDAELKSAQEKRQKSMVDSETFLKSYQDGLKSLEELKTRLDSLSFDPGKYDEIKKKKSSAEAQLKAIETESGTIKIRLQNPSLGGITEDIQELLLARKEHEELKKKLNALNVKSTSIERDIRNNNNKIKLLAEVPCNAELWPKCKFVCEASKANVETESLVNEMQKHQETAASLHLEAKKYATVDDKIQKYHAYKNQELQIERDNTRLASLDGEKAKLIEVIEAYTQSLGTFADVALVSELRSQISKTTKEKDANFNCYNEAQRQIAFADKETEFINTSRAEFERISREYAAYELYLRCMHSDGIAYEIIKKNLPIINSELDKILAGIVDFKVVFDGDDKKLDILLQHEGGKTRAIELCSGAETTIAAIAIRLAMLKITSLPVGDLFILDEPAAALDEEHMEAFVRMLDALKSNFKTVLLISHLDHLKDAADTHIVIENVDGFAQVSV